MTLATDLVKLNNLLLSSKLVQQEISMGVHISKRTGSGVEFEQYKHYQAGDDPKAIDWKLYARTGKHQIKQSVSESTMNISFIIDATGSMNYEENKLRRINFAKILLASLANLAHNQSDNISLLKLTKNGIETIVDNGKSAFQKILFELENIKASGTFPENEINLPTSLSKNKQLVVFVSDFLQVNNDFVKLIETWVNPRRELMLFQVLGEKELSFDLEGMFQFVDLETNKSIELSAKDIKHKYLNNINNYLENLDKELQLPNVYFHRCTMSEPIALILKQAINSSQWNS